MYRNPIIIMPQEYKTIMHAERAFELFADDMALYRVIKSNNDYMLLQNNVNAVSTFMASRLLQFNVTKCKFMFVSKKTSHSLLPPALYTLKWNLAATSSKLQISGSHII